MVLSFHIGKWEKSFNAANNEGRLITESPFSNKWIEQICFQQLPLARLAQRGHYITHRINRTIL